MIRFVATTSLVALLVLVLYLPSAYPPERFVEQVRIEHGMNRDFWGVARAAQVLSRTLDFQANTKPASPVPTVADAPMPNAVNAAVTNEMSQVNRRLFNNPYFRSIDALLVLAIYRLAVLLECLPILMVFMVAVVFDGFMLRIVKSKEFLLLSPEAYAVHVCAAIVTACATVIAFVLPVTLPSLALPAVPVALSIFMRGAVANFHRRA